MIESLQAGAAMHPMMLMSILSRLRSKLAYSSLARRSSGLVFWRLDMRCFQNALDESSLPDAAASLMHQNVSLHRHHRPATQKLEPVNNSFACQNGSITSFKTVLYLSDHEIQYLLSSFVSRFMSMGAPARERSQSCLRLSPSALIDTAFAPFFV
eukprot:4218648-Pleurochrysis_carterae.AAC.1